MYTIVKVIYGIPLTRNVVSKVDDLDSSGYKLLYHGGAEEHIGYCGVSLGDFDEVGNDGDFAVSINDINLTPTEDQKKEAELAISQLKTDARGISEIGVYFIFRTS